MADCQYWFNNYVQKYGYAPKQPRHLIAHAKTSGAKIQFSKARQIIAGNIKNSTKIDSETKDSNPYIDNKLTDNFISNNNVQTYMQKHQTISTKCNIATVYESYKEKKGVYPSNAQSLLSFCKQNNISMTYSECSQYIASLNTNIKQVNAQNNQGNIKKIKYDSKLEKILKSRLNVTYDHNTFENLETNNFAAQNEVKEGIDYNESKYDINAFKNLEKPIISQRNKDMKDEIDYNCDSKYDINAFKNLETNNFLNKKEVKFVHDEMSDSTLAQWTNEDVLDWIKSINLSKLWSDIVLHAFRECKGLDLVRMNTAIDVGNSLNITNPMLKGRIFREIKTLKKTTNKNCKILKKKRRIYSPPHYEQQPEKFQINIFSHDKRIVLTEMVTKRTNILYIKNLFKYQCGISTNVNNIIFYAHSKLLPNKTLEEVDIINDNHLITVKIRTKSVECQLCGHCSKCLREQSYTHCIIDNGSGFTKAVLSDNNASIVRISKQEYYKCKQGKYPITGGIINNFGDMELLWDYTFKYLKCNPSESYVILTESPFNSKENRELITRIMFETFNVKALCIEIGEVLSLYASERRTGIVLDSGYGVTHIVPVYNGVVLMKAVQTLEIAGNDITKYLMNKNYSNSNYIKETECYVSLEYENEMVQCCGVNGELFMAAEILFKPQLIYRGEEGIHKLLYKSIMKCDSDIRQELYTNIVVAGGSTMFDGFAERLKKEMENIVSESVEVNVYKWMGPSIVSKISKFGNMWITKEEYEKYGHSIVHTRGSKRTWK